MDKRTLKYELQMDRDFVSHLSIDQHMLVVLFQNYITEESELKDSPKPVIITVDAWTGKKRYSILFDTLIADFYRAERYLVVLTTTRYVSCI